MIDMTDGSGGAAVSVSGLMKSYGSVKALVGVDLEAIILIITGLLIGFSFHTSVLEAVGGLGLLLLFGYAMRSLWLGAPAGNNVWGAAVWAAAIIAVFAPLAVARYRRAAGQ
jgi:hypothetical protein